PGAGPAVTAVLPAAGDPPPPEAIEAAVRALADGRLVGVPTDTVYGLAADPFRPGATDGLFAAKGRPRTVELPVLVADVAQALSLAVAVPAAARALMARWWPGALTLVLPRRPGLAADLGSDEATVGVRCPDHPVALTLARLAGPLATTSANRHGQDPLETAPDVVATFGEAVAVVLDAGPCRGRPSTVVDCTGVEPRCLRPGRIPWDEVQESLR
ncbi:MAG: L-threonylcarbamoyladenylate synthase, partial [Acidimicrobiales bacterium]